MQTDDAGQESGCSNPLQNVEFNRRSGELILDVATAIVGLTFLRATDKAW